MAEKLFERVMEGVMFDDDPGVSGALLLYSTYCLGFREFFFTVRLLRCPWDLC